MPSERLSEIVIRACRCKVGSNSRGRKVVVDLIGSVHDSNLTCVTSIALRQGIWCRFSCRGWLASSSRPDPSTGSCHGLALRFVRKACSEPCLKILLRIDRVKAMLIRRKSRKRKRSISERISFGQIGSNSSARSGSRQLREVLARQANLSEGSNSLSDRKLGPRAARGKSGRKFDIKPGISDRVHSRAPGRDKILSMPNHEKQSPRKTKCTRRCGIFTQCYDRLQSFHGG